MAGIAGLWAASAADSAPKGDAGAGSRLFTELRCSTCHSVRGVGGTAAPALGPKAGQPYTPNVMVSSLWSHVTKMWDAMERAGVPAPRLTAQQTADLFAYLGGTPAGDQPGEVSQGKKVYEAKLCASCHDNQYFAPDLGPLAGKVNAFTLGSGLWEHGRGMLSRMVSRNMTWQTLTPEELGHLIAYLNTGD
jgi:mono/diheme cytochrome c family protein